MNEQESLRAVVSSLSDEVRNLTQTVPDVYISKAEVARIRRRIRLALASIVALILIAGVVIWQVRAGERSASADRDRRQSERIADQESAIRAIAEARDQSIRTNTCALKGLLEQAQSSSTRNPIPPGLDPDTRAFVERSRAQAVEIFDQELARLNESLSQLGNLPCPSTPTTTTTGAP